MLLPADAVPTECRRDSNRRPTRRLARRFISSGSEALRRAITVEVSHTPAELLKPETQARRGSGRSRMIVLALRVSCDCRVSSRQDLALGAGTPQGGTDHPRVPDPNERKDRFALVAPIVIALGHEVIAREIELDDVRAVTARGQPGQRDEHPVWLAKDQPRCSLLARGLILAPTSRSLVSSNA